MADVKISALPSSTTPLAGTEVLPIVQSSTTKKVTVADLTAGRSISTAGASLDGAVTINDSGADVDFRIESDTNANAFFLDGATGNVGIGGTALAYVKVDVLGTYSTSSATSVAFNARGTVPNGTTNDYIGVWVSGSTAGAVFTLARAQGFLYSGTSVGAGSTITNQYGFHANASVTAATNNYGFYSAIASGSNRWNLYCVGTAENYVANNLKIGGTAARATTAGTNQLVLFNGTAPVGTLANGVSFYSSSGEANVMDAAGNATLLSPHDAETNEWIFRSKHTPSGKVLRIDVEKMLRFINEHFDLDMVQEWTE